MIRSHDDAKLLLDRMEMYSCAKRIIDSGVLPKFVNGKLDGVAAHTLIRKQVKAYVSRKFPSAEVKLVHAGPKVFVSAEQSKYLQFISNGSRGQVERRRVIEFIDGAREAIEQLHATIRTMYGKIDLVREPANMYSLLIRCSGDGIRQARSQFEYIGILLTTLDTLKSKLDALMIAVPDIDNAYERGLAIKRQREEEQARRRIVEVEDIIRMMQGLPIDHVEEVAEIPGHPNPPEFDEVDDPLPILTNDDLAQEEHEERAGREDAAIDMEQRAAQQAVPRPTAEWVEMEVRAEPVRRRLEDVQVGEQIPLRGQTADQIIIDEVTVGRPPQGLVEAALGTRARRVVGRIAEGTVAEIVPFDGPPPTPVVEEQPTRRANAVAQAQMNEILRRMGHNV